jgi:molybdopterin-guanine dinucleotide biosynthesis protein A
MGWHKPALEVRGRPIIASVLEATHGHPVVVVGTPEEVPEGTLVVRESPPGGGPVAGIAAGLTALDELAEIAEAGQVELVGVVAGDLPFLTAEHLDELFVALTTGPEDIDRPGVALAVDTDGHANWLCAVWRTEVLRRRLDEVGEAAGTSVRKLLHGIRQVHVLDETGWSTDVDTPDDLDAARNRQD